MRPAYQLLKTSFLLWLLATSAQSLAVDTDNDGLPDDWEVANGRDPLVGDDQISKPHAPANSGIQDQTEAMYERTAESIVPGHLAELNNPYRSAFNMSRTAPSRSAGSQSLIKAKQIAILDSIKSAKGISETRRKYTPTGIFSNSPNMSVNEVQRIVDWENKATKSLAYLSFTAFDLISELEGAEIVGNTYLNRTELDTQTQRVECPNGGSAELTATATSSRMVEGTITYTNCRHQKVDIVLSGLVEFTNDDELWQKTSAETYYYGQSSPLSLEYSDLRLRGPNNTDIAFSGTLQCSDRVFIPHFDQYIISPDSQTNYNLFYTPFSYSIFILFG